MTTAEWPNLPALCIWREARGEGTPGMAGVANVIANRAKRHAQTPEHVVMVPWAFSSMTAPHDPQLQLFPSVNDAQYALCERLASQIALGILQDNTLGSTLYYDRSIDFPASWNPAVVQHTVDIGRLRFFREM